MLVTIFSDTQIKPSGDNKRFNINGVRETQP